MDMSKFLVDEYFERYEKQAKFMMGSSDPESLFLKEAVFDFSKYKDIQLGYSLENGYFPLLKKISLLYTSLNEKNIATMNGGEETIYTTMRALLDSDDEIVVHQPSFQSLSVIAREIGCKIVEFSPTFEDKWKFDINLLESKVTENTKAIILNYPHNPTGACLTDSEMKEIVQVCRSKNIILISDEVYRFLSIKDGYSTKSFADLYENAIALGSFSKTFASPALRLGWIATKNTQLMKKILAYRHFTSTCINILSQIAGSEILDNAEKIIQRNNSIAKQNAILLDEFIKRHKNLFEYVPPKGATTAYVKLSDQRNSMDFCMELLKETGVLIVPSVVLEKKDNFLRIGLGRKNFAEALTRVEKFLESR